MQPGMQSGSGRPTEATIDLAALAANARTARRLADGREVIAVVKADAYGHGVLPVARTLVDAGCARLAVVSVDEACRLRDGGVAVPVLVLGGVHDRAEAAEAAARGLTPVLHDADGLGRAAEAAAVDRPLPVQVEVDTGMRRMGVPAGEAPGLLADVAASPGLRLDGAFTHLACADEPDPAASLEQLERFRAVLAGYGGPVPSVHAVNSAGLLAGGRGGPHEQAYRGALPQANAVRPGLMLYGVAPSAALGRVAPLQPVMTLRAAVVALRAVSAGEPVGYGATWRAPADTRVATLPVGYADGVARRTGGRGHVWLAGARRPIVGRVSMDYVGVDVGDAPVRVGDEAIVFGPELPVEEAAAAIDTIGYELLVRVGARVPRRCRPAPRSDASGD